MVMPGGGAHRRDTPYHRSLPELPTFSTISLRVERLPSRAPGTEVTAADRARRLCRTSLQGSPRRAPRRCSRSVLHQFCRASSAPFGRPVLHVHVHRRGDHLPQLVGGQDDQEGQTQRSGFPHTPGVRVLRLLVDEPLEQRREAGTRRTTTSQRGATRARRCAVLR